METEQILFLQLNGAQTEIVPGPRLDVEKPPEDELPRLLVGIICIDRDGYLILQKRSVHKKMFPGRLNFCASGHVDVPTYDQGKLDSNCAKEFSEEAEPYMDLDFARRLFCLPNFRANHFGSVMQVYVGVVDVKEEAECVTLGLDQLAAFDTQEKGPLPTNPGNPHQEVEGFYRVRFEDLAQDVEFHPANYSPTLVMAVRYLRLFLGNNNWSILDLPPEELNANIAQHIAIFTEHDPEEAHVAKAREQWQAVVGSGILQQL